MPTSDAPPLRAASFNAIKGAAHANLSDYYSGRLRAPRLLVQSAMQAAAQGRVLSLKDAAVASAAAAGTAAKGAGAAAVAPFATAMAPASWGTYKARLTSASGIQIWVRHLRSPAPSALAARTRRLQPLLAAGPQRLGRPPRPCPPQAWDLVPSNVLQRAAWAVDRMLDLAPALLRSNLVKGKARLGIIAATQKLTDLPEFAWLANVNTFDGRPFSSLRGVGGTKDVPTTALGVELVMESSRWGGPGSCMPRAGSCMRVTPAGRFRAHRAQHGGSVVLSTAQDAAYPSSLTCTPALLRHQ